MSFFYFFLRYHPIYELCSVGGIASLDEILAAMLRMKPPNSYTFTLVRLEFAYLRPHEESKRNVIFLLELRGYMDELLYFFLIQITY